MIRHARPGREVLPEGSSADPGLTDLGRRQAEATAEFLSGEQIDHIVASSMRRAVDTAAPLAGRLGLDIEVSDDLRESDHRAHIYVPVEEMSPDDPDSAHYFDPDRDPNETIFPDGYEPFRQRVVRGFDAVVASNRSRTVAVFCHAMVTGAYLQTVMGVDEPLKLLVDYCGVSRVVASSTGERTVRSINETHHVRGLLERFGASA